MTEPNKAGAKPNVKPAEKTKETAPLKSKAERFKELAPKRTRMILKNLEVLGNCSNRGGYEYSEADILKIFGAIKKKIAEVEAKFSSTGKKETELFTL